MSARQTPLCLVIDESLMVRRVCARIVRDFGYEVIEAKTGQEGIDAAQLHAPAVVLLDWRAGEMGALDIIKALRAQKRGADIRIILCTADRSVERITQALSAGADEYIIKPFDSDIVESKFVLAGLPVRGGMETAA